MATYSFHWLIMGKVKIGIYCYLTVDILTKVLQKCSLSSPLWSMWILSKLPNLIGCHGNQKDKFAIKYSKIFSSEATMGMNLKLCRNVHNNSLYKNCVFLLPLLMCFHCYDNLKFPLTCNRKCESRPLLLSHCRYFDKSFTEMFLEFCLNLWICKKYSKNISSETVRGMKLKLCRNGHNIY